MGIDTARVVHAELLEGCLRELVCVFCSDLIDPHDALQAECAHVFCSSCIRLAIADSSYPCPSDKTMLSAHSLRPLKDCNQIVYRMLGRTEVRCANVGIGCKWQGDLFDAKAHDTTCLQQLRQQQHQQQEHVLQLGLHCQCCRESKVELQRATELIMSYERMVTQQKTSIRELKSQLRTLQGPLALEQRKAPGAPPVLAAVVDVQAQLSQQLDGLTLGSVAANYQQHQAGPGQLVTNAGDDASRPSSGSGAGLGEEVLGAGTYGDEQRDRVTGRLAGGSFTDTSSMSSDNSHGGLRPAAAAGAAAAAAAAPPAARAAGPVGAAATSRLPTTPFPKQPWQGGIFSGTLVGHTTRITALVAAPGPGGGTLFSGSLDGSVRMWRGGECVMHVAGWHAGTVFSLAYDAASATLYSCGEDKAVLRWREGEDSPQYVEEGRTFSHVPLRVCVVGQQRVAVAYTNGKVLVWDVPTQSATVVRQHGPCATPLDMVYSPAAGGLFASGNPDHSISVWASMQAVPISLSGHKGEVYSLAASPAGVLFSLSSDGTVREWVGGRQVACHTGTSAAPHLVVGADGTLYSGTEAEASVRAWRGGRVVALLAEHSVCRKEFTALALSDAGVLYCGESSGAIRMWQSPLKTL